MKMFIVLALVAGSYAQLFSGSKSIHTPVQTVSYSGHFIKPLQAVSYAEPLQTVSYAAPIKQFQTMSYAAPIKQFQTMSYAAPITYTTPIRYDAPVVSYARPLVGATLYNAGYATGYGSKG